MQAGRRAGMPSGRADLAQQLLVAAPRVRGVGGARRLVGAELNHLCVCVWPGAVTALGEVRERAVPPSFVSRAL